jgi:hypothetical protein
MIYDEDRTAEQFKYPYINRNGASLDSLLEARKAAYLAVLGAERALRECAPHGRDYQGAPAGAYESALEQYEGRIGALVKLSHELRDEALFIQGQEPERKRA